MLDDSCQMAGGSGKDFGEACGIGLLYEMNQQTLELLNAYQYILWLSIQQSLHSEPEVEVSDTTEAS